LNVLTPFLIFAGPGMVQIVEPVGATGPPVGHPVTSELNWPLCAQVRPRVSVVVHSLPFGSSMEIENWIF